MTRRLVVAVLLLGFAQSAVAQERWTSLFDGETLAGWEGSTDYFRVENGVIVGGTVEADIPQNEFLCLEGEHDDFELELDFRLDEGVNSGVQIRCRNRNHRLL